MTKAITVGTNFYSALFSEFKTTIRAIWEIELVRKARKQYFDIYMCVCVCYIQFIVCVHVRKDVSAVGIRCVKGLMICLPNPVPTSQEDCDDTSQVNELL